jgi:hypothetical protein
MTNVPEDSMLRRHYLTELRNKQTANFDAFISATKTVLEPESEVHYYPFWSNAVLLPLIGFVFMMCVVFL